VVDCAPSRAVAKLACAVTRQLCPLVLNCASRSRALSEPDPSREPPGFLQQSPTNDLSDTLWFKFKVDLGCVWLSSFLRVSHDCSQWAPSPRFRITTLFHGGGVYAPILPASLAAFSGLWRAAPQHSKGTRIAASKRIRQRYRVRLLRSSTGIHIFGQIVEASSGARLNNTHRHEREDCCAPCSCCWAGRCADRDTWSQSLCSSHVAFHAGHAELRCSRS